MAKREFEICFYSKNFKIVRIFKIFFIYLDFSKRDNILSVFSNIYGALEQEKADVSAESNRSGFGVDDIGENNRRAPQNSESTIWILKYWVKRAKLVRLIRSQVAGLLEKMTNPYCNFCGINWGLRGETIENIEEIFLDFWRELLEFEKKQKLKDSELKIKKKFNPRYSQQENKKRVYETSDIIKWQQYFQKHSTLRTICFECMNEVLEKRKRISCQIENKNCVETNVNHIFEDTPPQAEKAIKNCTVENKSLKEILRLWLHLARNNKKN